VSFWNALYISSLSSQIKQLLRMKEEQRREHERKMVELREASRRMKEDCEHHIEIERFVAYLYFYSANLHMNIL
jgi:hypothetical protein